MDVNIGELNSTVETVDSQSILSPSTMEQIVQAVLRSLANQQLQQERRNHELDLRSVVQQQRGDK